MEHYFTHSQETDIDLEKALDAEDFDDRLARVVHPLALAFEQAEDLDESFCRLVAGMLRQFLWTHKSIRLLMKNREENPAGMADAMSLAREQVEKVYTVALLLEDPEKWTERYLKDAWRNDYERHLIEAHERHDLERYEDYLNTHSDGLHKERLELGITDEEEEFVEWRFENPPGESAPPLPNNLKGARETMKPFPTPATIIRELADPDLKVALVRLYREYSYLCGYSHSGFRKLLPAYAEAEMDLDAAQKEKIVDTEYAQSIMLSYLSAALACAEAATRKLARGPGGASGRAAVADAALLAKLSELWDELEDASLVGRALYTMRTRALLPVLGGTA